MTTKTNVTLNPAEISVPIYQRNVDEKRVAAIAAEFNAQALGALTVAKRRDGSLWIVDGNHRRTVALRVGHKSLFAFQHEGLTLADEARMFLELNATKQVGAVDRFGASVIAEDPASIEINNVLKGLGWRPTMSSEAGSIASVGGLYSIYNGLGIAGQPKGISLVARTMATVTRAWGLNRDGGQSQIIRGIAKVLARYDGVIDPASLVERLSKITPANLIAEGKATAAAIGCVADVGVARRVVTAYNKNKRTGKIPDWEWSK